MAYIRTYRRGESTYVQLVFKDGRRISRIIHLGTAHTQIELDMLLDQAKSLQISPNQQNLFPVVSQKPDAELARTTSKLLYDLIRKNYDALGFAELQDEIFQHLVIARIVEPVSKLDSIRVLEELGISISKGQVYRSLVKIQKHNYRQSIASLCRKYRNIGDHSILLYDVTTLYFETMLEDGKRIPGLSKERRPEPQIVIGLLVDQTGFPLSLQMFAGNTAETKTIIPVLNGFKEEYKIEHVTVVADAAMLNQGNIRDITEHGFHYIIGSRQHKMPFAIEDYLKTHTNPVDLDIMEQVIDKNNLQQRAIYQYSLKRAKLDLENIDTQLDKARKIIAGKRSLKRNKFIRLVLNAKKLNVQQIEKAKSLAGFKGYITNLSLPAEEIIAHYHRLWHVEASFRMSKSDLRARPIFHHKEESIEAHLTIVMASMAVAKSMEEKSSMAIRRIVKLLKPLRTGILISKTSRSTLEIQPQIPEEHTKPINNLSQGY